MTPLERAYALRERGLSIFPIPYGTKIPTIAWKPYQLELPTDDELQVWFGDGQPTNIGIVTGAISGLVVIDADNSGAVAYCQFLLPYTPWQVNTARGRHFYFAHPGAPVSNRASDVPACYSRVPIHRRGDGGYVLAPHSRHPSGRSYGPLLSWNAPREALPVFDPAWFPPVRTVNDAASINRGEKSTLPASDFLVERCRRYLATIPKPEIGYGSDARVFFAACRLVRGFALPPADAEALLWEWCGNREGWTREWVSAKVASAERYGQEAVGGLR